MLLYSYRDTIVIASVCSNLPVVDDETKGPTTNREGGHSTQEDRLQPTASQIHVKGISLRHTT